MDEKIDVDDEVDDIILPGFRFHPTDEELVGYYLKRKIQHLPLPLELIKQLDIYKFDPWDLPKLAASGEREWYFYCPRDRKYRNSMRPNRVAVAGFWKATGIDRPIYSSDGYQCIGLKKSLVFYRGRASKGIKTDWMMHEFRLPSIPDSVPSNKFGYKTPKTGPATDSWAICRIFRKTSSSPTPRAVNSCRYLFPSLQETTTTSDVLHHQDAHSIKTENTAKIQTAFQCYCDNYYSQQSSLNPTGGISDIFMFTTLEASDASKCTIDTAASISMPSNHTLHESSKALDQIIDSQWPQQQSNSFSVSFPEKVQGIFQFGEDDEEGFRKKKKPSVRSTGFPVSLQENDAWKPAFPFDSTKFLVEMSTSTDCANNLFSS